MSTDDNVIRPEFGKLRNVEPSMTFLMSTDCLVQSILTASNTFLERSRARSPQARRQIPPLRRVERRYHDRIADNARLLTTYIHYETRIEHAWTYDN